MLCFDASLKKFSWPARWAAPIALSGNLFPSEEERYLEVGGTELERVLRRGSTSRERSLIKGEALAITDLRDGEMRMPEEA